MVFESSMATGNYMMSSGSTGSYIQGESRLGLHGGVSRLVKLVML